MKKLLYEQIAEQIIDEIIIGKLTPGMKMESVREMSVRLKVNPKSIQKAYDYLQELEVFDSSHGSGRYVTNEIEKLKQLKFTMLQREIDNFLQQISQYNFEKEEIVSAIIARIEDRDEWNN